MSKSSDKPKKQQKQKPQKTTQGAPQREARGQEARLRLVSPGRQVETRSPACEEWRAFLEAHPELGD